MSTLAGSFWKAPHALYLSMVLSKLPLDWDKAKSSAGKPDISAGPEDLAALFYPSQ